MNTDELSLEAQLALLSDEELEAALAELDVEAMRYSWVTMAAASSEAGPASSARNAGSMGMAKIRSIGPMLPPCVWTGCG